MYLNQYASQAYKTAIYPDEVALEYLTLGLMNEAGEVGGKVKKHLRGDFDKDTLKKVLVGELGDVLWYLALLCREAGTTLEDVADANLQKLFSRQTRDVLKGDGDYR